jgi:hypothetical protein
MGKNSFSVLNFAAHKVPEFKEQQSKDWILYITPSQVLLGGGDSFTVLAGRPQSLAREVNIWKP